ncbi:CRACD-like protein isoform X1 [Myotis daubentonii]|uniref:CRACD-like protein isoform X1 n=2 Tax=Myotis daubentonii TaxID=98922 RepID=UPI002873D733|nr:CRACD-like protein isoform X1 [Myotis daubentonii]XP_059514984.1 CRACD-like protein isoform X1 [Myotis daubentonii]XP_059514985.1 CRACD-like protein isoform X1 [Myotis daubentonii]
MISTRVMDFKLREAGEGLGEDSTGKKKSKFKTFKKLFGKKKRKESPSSAGGSAWKQSQAKSEVIAIEAGPVGYDSEDELEEPRGALGGRALSHDSIFIPESGQDPARPVRVFSQENVCDRIKALQLKIQCNVKMGPPPPPGSLPAKRGDDPGMSSEDDGLPRSPPEMSLLHDIGPGTTIKVSLVSSSRPPSPDQPSSRPPSDAPACPRTAASSVAPVADFGCPPGPSSCLDNSAAKHKLLVKPRNQRSSKMRRLSSRAQSECLGDLTCTPEEEESDEKPVPTVSAEESPSAGQHPGPRGLAPVLPPGRPRARRAQSECLGDLTCTPEEEESDEKPVPTVSAEETPSAGQQAGPGGPAPVLPPRARRVRLQHCPALSASAEEDESPPRDDPSSRQATPEVVEVTEPVPGPAPCLECPLLPEDSPHPDPDSKHQREEPSLESACPPSEEDAAGDGGCASGDAESSSPRAPEEDTAPPGTGPAVPLETPPGPDGPGLAAQETEEAGLTLAVPDPSPEGTEGTECSEDRAPSPPASKSCLKHKAPASRSLSVSPTPPTSEPPPQEPTPCALDEEAAPLESPRAEQGESPQQGAEREAPELKTGRGGSRPRGGKKFSVASGRAWPHTGHRERPARPGPVAAPSPVRLPLLRSSKAWRSEAALDDLHVPPERQNPELEPPSPAEHGPQDSGSRAARQAGPGQNPPEAVATPATREPRPSAQEPRPCGDRSPFPVKLRSTSLSFKHRDVAVPEGKGVKRYSAEVRLEKGGPALLSKDDKCHVGAAPTIRGTRTPNGQGKGKARASEQPGSKPPLPRKPLLQSLTLPYPPAGPDVSPGELDKVAPPPGPRKESRTVEKRLPRRGAEKGLPPAASGPGAEGRSGPPWITITPQKRRGAPEQPPNREDKPGAQTLKPEIGKAARAPERAQEPVRQADFVRSKSFLITPAKPAVDRRQGTELCLQEGLQRGISLSHQNLAAQPAAMAERDLHQLKRASYASAEQPSWMELARKKSQAWSDMPQIIK